MRAREKMAETERRGRERGGREEDIRKHEKEREKREKLKKGECPCFLMEMQKAKPRWVQLHACQSFTDLRSSLSTIFKTCPEIIVSEVTIIHSSSSCPCEKQWQE